MIFNSLKTKLIVGMALLLVLAFGVAAMLLIQQKTWELSEDIYREVRSFSDLTAPQVVGLYENYLAEDSFVYFNRELQKLFGKTAVITNIGLAEYEGRVLYDSTEEQARQYEGEPRVIPEGSSMLDRVQATYPSYSTASGRIIYLKVDAEGAVRFVDLEEQPVEAIDPLDRIQDVIYPYGSRFAVLYSPSYDLLDQRIQAMWVKIVLLTVFALLIGMAYATFFSTRITQPLKTLQAGAIQLGQGDLKTRVTVKTHDEVGLLASTFNQMAGDLEKSVEARVYKERLSKELELAASIQKQILPKAMPKIPGLEVAAGVIPATEVGGDVFDFFSPDGENYFGYVGDVTGHGVPAGLVGAVANAVFHSYSPLKNPTEILVAANKLLKLKTTTTMFVTLALWHWNVKTEQFTHVSAGHEVSLRFTAATVKTDELEKGGMALGMLPDVRPLLKPQTITLAKGDCIILYSDGVPECWRNEKEQYGMVEFKRVVTQSCDLPMAESIKIALLADVKQWSKGYEQKDDITVMVIKRL